MAHTYALGQARTATSANPYTVSYTVASGDTVVALLIKTQGNVVRTGGAPTLGGETFIQADIARIFSINPEVSAEIWYLVNPAVGTNTLTVPNTTPHNLWLTVGIGRSATGVSAFDSASGNASNATNPSPGAATVAETGEIGFAIVAGGWTTWAPSAQVGTIIANTDDGTHGSGEQYILDPATGSHTLGWTFGTGDDWGAVSAYFKEVAAAAGQPTMKRWGGIPHMGGRSAFGRGHGGVWHGRMSNS